MSHNQVCSTIAGSCSRTVRRISGPAAGSLRSSDSAYPVPHASSISASDGMCTGQLTAQELTDRALPPPDPRHAVVIEHRHPVGGQPDVALEAGRAEAKCQLERLDRVLRRVRTSATVGERDRWIET